ncbi:hypothetical protein EDD16DRAFT_1528136 [Pisolithus croceorrhizus]|nr:hypothetical protein EDD16DRAFT_1528136 [Pisolithus croceorrhizus]KAI6169907.1 hypothetical protein EDD17DRAFT_1502798 [Pisolithus thermaeus]
MHPDLHISDIPHGWQMKLTDKVAEYMQNHFWEEVFKCPHALPHTSIPIPLLCRADRIIPVIIEAYKHPVWHSKTQDIVASLQYNEITTPAVIINTNGTTRLWYLLGAITQTYQNDIWNSLHCLQGPLAESVNHSHPRGWRNNGILFCQVADIKGSLNLSPAWQLPNFHPEVSRLLKSQNAHNGVHRWVNRMSKFHALLSGTLSMIHPHMYAAGHEVFIRLNDSAKQRKDADMQLILPIRNLVYNSMSIMVNCTTPYHTDINGWEPWLDMLIMSMVWDTAMGIVHASHTICDRMYISQLAYHYVVPHIF